MPRPILFDPKKADAIVAAVTRGETIGGACAAAGVSRGTFYGWVAADRGGLRNRFAEAKRKLAPTSAPTPSAALAPSQADRFSQWVKENREGLAERAARRPRQESPAANAEARAKASETVGAAVTDHAQGPPQERPGIVSTWTLNDAAIRALVAGLEAAVRELQRQVG